MNLDFIFSTIIYAFFEIFRFNLSILEISLLFCYLSFQLSEMTADLGEEHSAATLATERLEAEQAERMKLQKDNSELQVIIDLEFRSTP